MGWKNKEKAREYDRKRYPARQEKVLEYLKEYRENNREHLRELCREYYHSHKREMLYKNTKRRSNKVNRTPCWANLEEIKNIYKNCPVGYHVDHIVPLCGKYVSGLHVEYNLQYLIPEENLAKGNKFPYKDYN